MMNANKRKETHLHEEVPLLPHAGSGPSDAKSTPTDWVNNDNLDLTTQQGFESYRNHLLSSVPDNIKSRFRGCGFCKWGKEGWLPVLELGPFDVEPGPVREMWLEMFEKSQKHGRAMKRLVFWYGVRHEDRGQSYSFVSENQLVTYEEGQQKGHCSIPKKIQNKIVKEQKLTKKESQLKRGLSEIEADTKREKSKRVSWMMQFEEDYMIAEEEQSAHEVLKSKLKPSVQKSKQKGKRKTISKQTKPVTPDDIVSSNINIDGDDSISSSKRTRHSKALASPVSSSSVRHTSEQNTQARAFATDQKNVNVELTISGDLVKSEKVKHETTTRKGPTLKEYQLVVQELGKLHPDVIAENDQRFEMWALRKKQVKSKHDGKTTPITDAIISTMLSQNTTAANQNRAFASLKKAFPGGWGQVADETNVSRIEDAIRVAGLAQVRAERMQSMLQTIQRERGEANFEFLQHVHSNDDIISELKRHKGMGPKTISCVLLFALGRPDFPVDTHVLRISKQMGWIPESFSREAAYEHLNGHVPDDCKLDLHCLLVTHGKQCHKCAARGRAQFPPKIQWVCPMAGIRNRTLSAGAIGPSKLTAVKSDSKIELTSALESESKVSLATNQSTDRATMKVEQVISADAALKLEDMEQDGRLFRC